MHCWVWHSWRNINDPESANSSIHWTHCQAKRNRGFRQLLPKREKNTFLLCCSQLPTKRLQNYQNIYPNITNYKMYPTQILNASKMCLKCILNVPKLYLKCIQNITKMYPKLSSKEKQGISRIANKKKEHGLTVCCRQTSTVLPIFITHSKTNRR